mgnify:CR=1 FL=1
MTGNGTGETESGTEGEEKNVPRGAIRKKNFEILDF